MTRPEIISRKEWMEIGKNTGIFIASGDNKINKNLIWDICNIQGFKIKGDTILNSLARKHKKFCENRNYEHGDFIVDDP